MISKSTNRVEAEGLTIKDLKSKIQRNFHWFVIFACVGVVLAFIYNKLAPQYYQISSTILIKNDGKSSELNNIFRQLNSNSSSAAIQDQVGVLRSYNLNLKTMQYFNWRYTWSKVMWFSKKDLYGNEPFIVEEPAESFQIEGVELKITPRSNDQFNIFCDKEIKIKGKVVNIEIDEDVLFGSPYKDNYFHFVLKKRPDSLVNVDEEYILVFNNLSQLALEYKEKLKVKPANDTEDSNLINIELRTSQLERDVDYLNQLGKIYIQFGLDEKNRIANNTIKFIDDQITGVDRSLQLAGDQFSSFRARNRTVDLGQEATSVVEKLKQIEMERADLDLKLDYYNNLKFYLQNRDQNKDLVAPSLVGVTDEALNQKVIRLNELYVKREVLSYTAQERNPVLISVTNEINYTQKSLQENVDNLIANANVELQNLNYRQRSINNELSKLPKTEQDLIGIKRNFDLNNELYTFLLQRRAEAEILKASNNPDAQILDPTDTQIAQLLGPKLVINFLVGLFGGLFIALSIVLVRELITEVITGIEEVSEQLNVALLGTIGINKFKTERPVYRYPRSALAESFRGLRVNLEYLLKETSGNIVAVHSFISGEGKSFVTLNLAMIFAMSNRKVLLVDGDLRMPSLHNLLKQKVEVGLSDFLEQNIDSYEIIRKTDFDNLSFISAGDVQFNSPELLSNGKFESLIEDVKEKFDLIIIDNAPIGVVNDPVILGSHADINLILLRLNYSKRNEIESINKIGQEGLLKGVTVAVNGVKQAHGYGYYTEDTIHEKSTKKPPQLADATASE